MMVCSVICNAKTPMEMAAYLEAREPFFTVWLGLKKGLPSHRLLAILMMQIESSAYGSVDTACLRP